MNFEREMKDFLRNIQHGPVLFLAEKSRFRIYAEEMGYESFEVKPEQASEALTELPEQFEWIIIELERDMEASLLSSLLEKLLPLSGQFCVVRSDKITDPAWRTLADLVKSQYQLISGKADSSLLCFTEVDPVARKRKIKIEEPEQRTAPEASGGMKLLRFFKNKIFSFAMIQKVYRYLRRYGLKRTVIKIIEKTKNIDRFKRHGHSFYLPQSERTKQEAEQFAKKVRFSVIVPLYNTNEVLLRAMLDSVVNQTYQNWQLCLADGSDAEHPEVAEIVRSYTQKDNRIVYKKLAKNEGISLNTNAAMDMADGDYLCLFDHDDLLHPSALYEYCKVINEQDADFIYCDEATFSKNPEDCYTINFKPDYAPDTLRSNNYICHFTVFQRELVEAAGKFNHEYDGSQDYDMILRLTEKAKKIVHVAQVLYYWRAHEQSVALNIEAKPYALISARKALQAHMDRVGLGGTVEDAMIASTYHIRYELTSNPLISIIIPNKDEVKTLKKCIDSILRKSTYKNYEIIVVENNSEQPETFNYYRELEKNDKIKVIYYEGGFNYSRINNFGVTHATGQMLLLLNNDTEVISLNWLEELLMFAQRNDVGAVGAKLLYPDKTIQHAGVILGLGGIAGHVMMGEDSVSSGYMGRLAIAQNMTAVTGACLMISKQKYEEVGGLTEAFAVAFNDIDFCMKLRKKGYLNVYTPHAVLFHYESKSRGQDSTAEKQRRFESEIRLFQDTWQPELDAGDPYYNPNLSINQFHCEFK